MPTISLEAVQERYTAARSRVARRIILCAGTGCLANGALAVHQRLTELTRARGLNVTVTLDTEGGHAHDREQSESAEYDLLVSSSGCQGFCQVGPLLSIEPDGILYVRVGADDVDDIVTETLEGGRVVERLLYEDPRSGERKRGHDAISF
jgi:NADH-quinone oxidoreductase subunit F